MVSKRIQVDFDDWKLFQEQCKFHGMKGNTLFKNMMLLWFEKNLELFELEKENDSEIGDLNDGFWES